MLDNAAPLLPKHWSFGICRHVLQALGGECSFTSPRMTSCLPASCLPASYLLRPTAEHSFWDWPGGSQAAFAPPHSTHHCHRAGAEVAVEWSPSWWSHPSSGEVVGSECATKVPAAILSSIFCVDGRVIVLLMPGSFWTPKVIIAIPFCSFTVPSTLKLLVENAMIEREDGVDALVAESKRRERK